MDIIDILFERNMIIKENEEELYYKIKMEKDIETENFIKEKLGYKLIIDPNLIKLEKIPGKPQSFMGIEEFTKNIEYIFLCLILMYLETKTKKEQFILSEMIDYIKNIQSTIENLEEKIDFNITKQRQSMVVVLKYIKKQGFIKMYDGSEDKFSESIENDILYEVTGMSKYFVRLFNTNISNCNNYEDIMINENMGLNQEIGIERTQRVYRRLLTEAVVYNEEGSETDYQYIKQYKKRIEYYLDKVLGVKLYVHKNGAYIISDKTKNAFPSTKAISDVVMFVNTYIANLYKLKKLEADENDIITCSTHQFSEIIKKVKEKYEFGFSKEYKRSTLQECEKNVIRYMQEFSMIKITDHGYQIMPIVFKLKATYPKDINKKDCTKE